MFSALTRAINPIKGLAKSGFGLARRGMGKGMSAWRGMAFPEKLVAGSIAATAGIAGWSMSRGMGQTQPGIGAPPKGWQKPADYQGGAWWAYTDRGRDAVARRMRSGHGQLPSF
jgi:hypothetical protein